MGLKSLRAQLLSLNALEGVSKYRASMGFHGVCGAVRKYMCTCIIWLYVDVRIYVYLYIHMFLFVYVCLFPVIDNIPVP